MIGEAVNKALVQFIVAEGEFGNWANNGDFSRICERRPSAGDSQIAKLDHLSAFSVNLKETVASAAVLFDKVDQFFL